MPEPQPPGWEAPRERRVAIVTGASAGLGRAIAARLGAFGWAIGVGARRVDRLHDAAGEVRAAGGEAFACHLDVTDAASVEAFTTAVEEALGPVEVLVNNAAVGWPGPVHGVTAERIRATIETNLLGPLYMTRRVASAMLERGSRGDIVFITSEAADQLYPYMVPYGCSKAALEYVVKGLDAELEGTGIRVGAVRLGPSISEWNLSWTVDEINRALEVWQSFGVMRNYDYLHPATVAEAVAIAVTAPRGAKVSMLTLRPEVPPADAPQTDALSQGRDRLT